MILYFADRRFNVLDQASTSLPEGIIIIDDNKIEDIETGVATFECTLSFDSETRERVKACTQVGNFILRSHNDENEYFTIIDTEWNEKNREVYIYAEDAGLDLLNEIVGAYVATEAKPISYYIEKFAYDSGFEIGINEIKNLTRMLSWDGEDTITARLASVATQFDNAEISYSFDVKGLRVVKKYINIHKKRGQDAGVQLRMNKEIDNIVISKSIANVATALRVTGGIPEDSDLPITLDGYEYDDGDFFLEGTYLKSREAHAIWSRYLAENGTYTGHICRRFEYDTTSQEELCKRAIAELKKMREVEVNYKIDITNLPENVKVGDRVNVVDDENELYVSARILVLETSVVEKTQKATIGEYLIKESGISQKVSELAAQFAVEAVEIKKAHQEALAAKQIATEAEGQINDALTNASNAQAAADAATQAAQQAQEAANNAQSVVESVEKDAEDAKAIAELAQQAAATAETKATESHNVAVKAQEDAAKAQTTADEAKTNASQAMTNASDASIIANAAKLDAENAQKDINTFAGNLTTLEDTMKADYSRKSELTEATASLQTQITRNADEISSTASRITTIDETANNAKEQADKAKEDVDALAVRMTTAETSISQNSEQIELRAKKTEVTETLGGYYTKPQTDAAIVAKANEITSSVSATYASKDDVNNIEIGGRNLLLETRDFIVTNNRWTGWINPSGYTIEEDDEGFCVASISSSGLTGAEYKSCYSSVFKASTGDEFTVSCWFMVDDVDALDNRKVYIFETFDESGNRVQWDDCSLDRSLTATLESGKWVRLVSKHTVAYEGENLNCGLRLCLFQNGSVHYKKCKLEKGNKATDWTPAPEDMAAADDVKTLETRVTQTEKSITSQASEISEHGTKISTLEQTANGFSVSLEEVKDDVENAQSSAEIAATSATNFLGFDSANGLLVGNRSGGSWSGYRAQVKPDSFNILDENGNELATYGANKVELGKNSEDTVIELCGGKAKIQMDSSKEFLQFKGEMVQMLSEDVVYGEDYNEDGSVEEYAYETSAGVDASYLHGGTKGYRGVRMFAYSQNVNDETDAGGSWVDIQKEHLTLETFTGNYENYAGMTFFPRHLDIEADEYVSITTPLLAVLGLLNATGLSVNGNEIVDFVVETGTSGIWTYEKWNSGKARCWGKISVTDKAVTTEIGALYRSATVYTATDYAFPFAFADVPVCTSSFGTTNGTSAFLWAISTPSKTAPAEYYLMRPNSATSSGVIDIVAEGKWK